MEFNEVIKRRRMVRAFTAEPLAPGPADRLLRAANRAPSAGFSQGYSFLLLEGQEQSAPMWQLLYEQNASEGTTEDDGPDQVDALSPAPLVIVPMASKDVYLDRYARPGKGWTDRDEARWPIPYWYVDTGFTVGHPDPAADPVAPARGLRRPGVHGRPPPPGGRPGGARPRQRPQAPR